MAKKVGLRCSEDQWLARLSRSCKCPRIRTHRDAWQNSQPQSLVFSLKGTDWGDLDVLVLDLPPGTGDVQLTVCQDVDLSGAVGVTTPSKLALADARKGIEMFSKLGISTMAMVENMAYFDVSLPA